MASHPLRMRKALGSNPSVSIADSTYLAQQKTSTGSWLFLCPSCWRARSARVAELALQRLCKRKVMGSIPRVVVHISWSCSRYMLEVKRFPWGTSCSGITSAPHAEGPGLKSQCVHCAVAVQPLGSGRRQAQIPVSLENMRMYRGSTPSVLVAQGAHNIRSHDEGVWLNKNSETVMQDLWK